MIQAEEAITAWLEVALDDGQSIPKPSSIQHLQTLQRVINRIRSCVREQHIGPLKVVGLPNASTVA